MATISAAQNRPMAMSQAVSRRPWEAPNRCEEWIGRCEESRQRIAASRRRCRGTRPADREADRSRGRRRVAVVIVRWAA